MLLQLCSTCYKPSCHDGCASVFRTLLEPIRCPDTLLETHAVCPFCLELYPSTWSHAERCLFAAQQIYLRAGGWSTPLSGRLLKSLRQSASPYQIPLINLLRYLLTEVGVREFTVVPIPMGSPGRRDRWLEIVQASVASIPGATVVSVLARNKEESTRQSVAQQRRAIVLREYSIKPVEASLIRDRVTILLDDNVTTGATILQCTRLLQGFEPAELIPMVIERNLAIRLLQQCPTLTVADCAYYKPGS